jgi:hypothetical protein
MSHRSILLLTLCLALAGCMTAAQRAQNDEQRCAARGLPPNSDAFKDCVVQLETERQMRIDARHREQVERSANPLPR